ncbi:MAG: ATP-binding cassette domain-containing protein, partial [Verrucomicrobiae bacterium]|nr:ATP-binding cassette domain-containing protein [Verrucomicrobiae bacterium]
MTTHRTPHDAPAIEATGLTRTFRAKNATVTAVDGLDLTVRTGEMVAFLGPNGAGKSTTLRMLTTLLPPTSGAARIGGFDVAREGRRVRGVIGYVGQGNGAGHWHHGRDELVGQARAHGMTTAQARARVDELTDAL